MADQLATATAYLTAAENQYNQRGAEVEDAANNAEDLTNNQVFRKLQESQSAANKAEQSPLMEEQRIGGAIYLPLKKDVAQTWEAVQKALTDMEGCDINLSEAEQYNAYALQFFRDTFMLARARLCKVEGEDENMNFLELHGMEGDGFVFADQFKPALVEKLGDYVEDVETVEPVASENAMDSFLNYLDLSDEVSAGEMIQLWLSTLKPKGGVKYDQRAIYETMSSLGWNCGEENNFKVLQEYSDYIVSPILEILRHEETTHVPTAYFGALCVSKFVENDAVPEDVKTWSSVLMLVEALEKFCTFQGSDERSIAEFQITSSRQVLKLLVSLLVKFAPTCSGDRPKGFEAKVEKVLGALNEPEADSLRNVLTVAEEVQTA